MKKHSLWLASGLMLCLSACYFPTSSGKRTMVEHTVNPQPKQAYQITMTLADAPGPPRRVSFPPRALSRRSPSPTKASASSPGRRCG